MQELIILAFKDTTASEIFKKCKREGIKYRRKLVQIDNVIFAMAIAKDIWCFDRHESGIKVLDLTYASYDEGATLMEQTIDKYNLRIN